MPINLNNMSLINRMFAISWVCGIDFQSLVQKGMSTNSSELVRYGIRKIACNGLESVLIQNSLGNAMEICSAVENV